VDAASRPKPARIAHRFIRANVTVRVATAAPLSACPAPGYWGHLGPASPWCANFAAVTVVRKLAVLGTGTAGAAPGLLPWLARRLFPLLATAGLIIIGISSTVWWGPGMYGKTAWALPLDLWGTLAAAHRLLHLHLGGLYTQPTGLITLPGAVVILLPLAAVIDAAGISLAVQSAANPRPAVWLLAGPYETALSAVALFAADALAEHLGATRFQRAVLAAASAIALWSVSVRWGHPEDAVSVGLFLYAILALARSRLRRAAWLAGAAIAIQPLVLLAVPVVAMTIAPRRLPGFLIRAATPAAVALAAAAAANWNATYAAVTSQPNSPTINHPTPWEFLAPHLSSGAVAAGPARIVAILVACGCAVVAGRRWYAARATGWDRETLTGVLWWSALALALRCVFEPVIVTYYMWPAMAVALIAASGTWARLIPASLAATALTFASQVAWHGIWTWWAPMMTLLALTLLFARFPLPLRRPGHPGEPPPVTRADLQTR